jgi:hypothetical protein
MEGCRVERVRNREAGRSGKKREEAGKRVSEKAVVE